MGGFAPPDMGGGQSVNGGTHKGGGGVGDTDLMGGDLTLIDYTIN